MAKSTATSAKPVGSQILVTLNRAQVLRLFGQKMSVDQKAAFERGEDLPEDEMTDVLGNDDWDFIS